jgi:Family of unknown function (DUF6529)
MTSEQTSASPARDQFATPILVSLLGGCAVAIVLGVYSKLHHPTGFALDIAGFSSPLYAKAWLTTAAVVFAVVQLATAYRMRRPAAAWVATLHRWSGRIAVVLTVPVIIHCIYALGFGTYSLRVIVHSVLGCLFYGAFVAKMLSLGLANRDTMPRWLIPVLGGAVLLSLIGLWATSALWLFTTKGLHS